MSSSSNTNHDPVKRRGQTVSAAATVLGMFIGALVLTSVALVLGPRLLPEGDLVDGLPRDEHYFDYVILDTKVELVGDAGLYDVWGIGDSSCLFGFSPMAFERGSGLSAVNFGTFGFVGVDMHQALLARLLENGAIPKAVLLWLHPHTLARSSDENAATGYPQWFADRLDGNGGGPLEFLQRANDLYGGTMRVELLDHAGWGRPQLGELLTPDQVKSRVLESQGWFPAEPMEAEKHYGCYEIHPDAERALTSFGDLCREYGIRLYLYVMPVLEGDPCGASYLADSEQQIFEALGTGTLVTGVPRRVEWTEMQSPTHFARDAAARNSELVGRRVIELGLNWQ